MRLVVAGNHSRVKRKSLAGQCVLVLLGLQLMFLSSFVAVDLPTGTGRNLIRAAQHSILGGVARLPLPWQERINRSYPNLLNETKPIRFSLYMPQVPVAIFLGYVLGRLIAPIAVGLFVLLGLFGPLIGINPFAGGGGFEYYSQPGFGYLLGMIAGSYVVGWITDERRTSLAQLWALAAGVTSVHLIGLVYLLGSCLIFTLVEGASSGPVWLPWVFEQARNLTWYPLAYDFLFGFILIGIGFPFRYLVNMLTAPDVALKSKGDRIVQQNMEELLS
jgi:biotin transporter BioY